MKTEEERKQRQQQAHHYAQQYRKNSAIGQFWEYLVGQCEETAENAKYNQRLLFKNEDNIIYDLGNGQFQECDFSYTHFYCNLENANFTRAILTDVYFGEECVIQGAVFDDVEECYAHMIVRLLKAQWVRLTLNKKLIDVNDHLTLKTMILTGAHANLGFDEHLSSVATENDFAIVMALADRKFKADNRLAAMELYGLARAMSNSPDCNNPIEWNHTVNDEVANRLKIYLQTKHLSSNRVELNNFGFTLAYFKNKLSHIRNENSKPLESLEVVQFHYDTVTAQLKGLFEEIVNFCVDLLDVDNNNISIILFGSLATNRAVLYSDVEYALLLDERITGDDRAQYETLAELIELIVISFGETPLHHARDIEDYLIQLAENTICKGFRIDTTKSPLASRARGKYSMIGNVAHFTEKLIQDLYEEDDHTSSALLTPAPLKSDDALFDRYNRTLHYCMLNGHFDKLILGLLDIHKKNQFNQRETLAYIKNGHELKVDLKEIVLSSIHIATILMWIAYRMKHIENKQFHCDTWRILETITPLVNKDGQYDNNHWLEVINSLFLLRNNAIVEAKKHTAMLHVDCFLEKLNGYKTVDELISHYEKTVKLAEKYYKDFAEHVNDINYKNDSYNSSSSSLVPSYSSSPSINNAEQVLVNTMIVNNIYLSDISAAEFSNTTKLAGHIGELIIGNHISKSSMLIEESSYNDMNVQDKSKLQLNLYKEQLKSVVQAGGINVNKAREAEALLTQLTDSVEHALIINAIEGVAWGGKTAGEAMQLAVELYRERVVKNNKTDEHFDSVKKVLPRCEENKNLHVTCALQDQIARSKEVFTCLVKNLEHCRLHPSSKNNNVWDIKEQSESNNNNQTLAQIKVEEGKVYYFHNGNYEFLCNIHDLPKETMAALNIEIEKDEKANNGQSSDAQQIVVQRGRNGLLASAKINLPPGVTWKQKPGQFVVKIDIDEPKLKQNEALFANVKTILHGTRGKKSDYCVKCHETLKGNIDKLVFSKEKALKEIVLALNTIEENEQDDCKLTHS